MSVCGAPLLHPSTLKSILERAGLRTTVFHLNPFHHQLEDLEVTVADHIQRVLKPNFGAAWDELGDEYEKEETFTLSAIKTLEGEGVSELFTFLLAPFRSVTGRLLGQIPSQAVKCRAAVTVITS